MSDEPTPPPLRLKPRVRPEPEHDAAPVAPAAPASPPAEPVRLKPRLFVEANAAEIGASPAPQAIPASIPPAAEEPRPASATTGAATPPAEQADRPKLKVRPPEGAVPAAMPPDQLIGSPAIIPALAGAVPPTIPSAPLSDKPPPFPVVAQVPAPNRNFPPPPSVPHLRAPKDVKEADLISGKPRFGRRGALRKIIPIVGLLAVLGVAAAYVYRTYFTPDPASTMTVSPPKSGASATGAAKPGPTPSTTLNAIAAAPGQAIGKARDAVAARDGVEQVHVDSLTGGGHVPAVSPVAPTAVPLNGTPATAARPAPAIAITSVSQLAPGVTATTTTSEMSGAASPSFQAWVSSVRINGVFHGNPPRALINGRAVRSGQSVDDSLGIVFESVDTEAKTITFRDSTGAQVSRRY